MKQIICCAMAVVLIMCMTPVPANAAEMEIIYLDDGSYITVEVQETNSRAAGNISGSKTYTHYGNSGTSDWQAVLTGTFSYTGTSATCTKSSVDVTVYDSAWYVVSKSAGKSGNQATGSVTMGWKKLGVTVERVPVSMTLSCDANGNLS